jgi:hypothetical protein
MKKRRPNYRRVGDTYLIELKLDNLQQLFNVLDPAPFRDKDLAPAAEEYIVDAAAEFSMDTQLKLMLHLPGTAYDEEHTTGVPQAIRNYFAYRTAVMARQFKEVLAQGRKSLVIGVGFLSFCLLGHHAIAALGKSGLFWSVLEEGFLITGWVAMWHPIDLFLYKWWPVRRRQHLMEKLAQIEVEMKRRETA